MKTNSIEYYISDLKTGSSSEEFNSWLLSTEKFQTNR